MLLIRNSWSGPHPVPTEVRKTSGLRFATSKDQGVTMMVFIKPSVTFFTMIVKRRNHHRSKAEIESFRSAPVSFSGDKYSHNYGDLKVIPDCAPDWDLH